MADLFDTTTADRFAVLLPSVSALAAMGAGVTAFIGLDHFAALLGGLGGVAASGGIFAAYLASKIRDDQMRFWIIAAAEADAQTHTGFGS
jgi:hypothetical protein